MDLTTENDKDVIKIDCQSHASSSGDESTTSSCESSTSSTESDDIEVESKEKRKRKSSSSKKKSKKQKKTKLKKKKLLKKVLTEVFRINTDLAGLSKSVAVLEEDMSLYENIPSVPVQSAYTLKNLPTFPIVGNMNEFHSENVSVNLPVNTVDEANDLNTILQDKIAFQSVVSLLYITVSFSI